MPSAMLADILQLARQLSPLEKVQLIEQIAHDVEAELSSKSSSPTRRRTLRGLLRDCPVSVEDIDSTRQELWRNFPRDDS